jgi:hypothetical protein
LLAIMFARTSRWSVLVALASLGCSRHDLVDFAMGSAYRPAAPPVVYGSPLLQIVSGDLHCHVAPPDDASDVTRALPATADLAKAEGIDFVVLTPHVWSRFFMDAKLRSIVQEGQRDLRAAIAIETKRTGVLFIPGFEYTDQQYGHVGVSFGDLDAVLSDVPLADAQAHPEKFFEQWVAHDGVLSIHHPLVTPIPGSSFSMAKADLSWRPFTAPGKFPAEIDAVTRLAQGHEVFNLTATHLRDRYLLHDGLATIRASLARLDQEVRTQGRRIAALGGSDSHEDHLRAATFVLTPARTIDAIRTAIVSGRTCVRDGAACTFTARSPGGTLARVGDAVSGSELAVSATGDDIEIFLDGDPVATPKSDQPAKIKVPERCAVLRARVGKGWSSPIYANCKL